MAQVNTLHYLDNAATTAVLPEVADIVNETLRTHWANPSSLYAPGFEAEQIVETARAQLAAALGATPKEVVFTASGTESDNLAILGAALARREWASHIVATGYEHPAAEKPLRFLETHFGFALTLVNPDETGRVKTEELVAAVTSKTALVCAMHVNNEVGSILDVDALAAAVKQKNSRTAVHVDGVQAFCKLPLQLAQTQIDSYAVSAHKIHGPKGVGALYLRKGYHFVPPLTGGAQEGALRPGTENTAGIAGFGKAVQLALQSRAEHTQTVQALQAKLLAGLAELPDITFNSPEDAQRGIVNISLPGIRSETMLHFLENRGVYVSAGSACSSGQPSHTLLAMGKTPQQAASALRISFDGYNTEEDITALLAGLTTGLATLARGRVGGRK